MARQEELFALTLGVKVLIYIETVEFGKGKDELHIRMNFRREANAHSCRSQVMKSRRSCSLTVMKRVSCWVTG